MSLNGNPPQRPGALNLFLFEALDFDQVRSVGGADFYVYRDPGLSASAGATIDGWLNGAFPPPPCRFDEDVTDLVSLLGAFPTGYHHVVLLRSADDTDFLDGFQNTGVAVVKPFDTLGAARAGTRRLCKVGAHELAHAWFGERVDNGNNADAKWLVEGMASFAQLTLYNSFHPGNTLTQAEKFIIERTLEGKRTNLEELPRDDEDRSTEYLLAPYTLNQLYWVARARGVSHAEFWAAWAVWLDGFDYGDTFDVSDVRRAVIDVSGSTTFYDDWTFKDSLGIPMLGLTSLTLAPSASGHVEITQVQNHMFGAATGEPWTVFRDVPYWLACSPQANENIPVFIACNDSYMLGMVQPPALTTGATTDTLTLSLRPALGVDPTPLWMELVSGAGMVATRTGGENWSVGGLSGQKTGFLVCVGDPLPACTTDGDGDGHPQWGDCDDGHPLAYPFQLAPGEVAATSPYPEIDLNCDGWVHPDGW